MLMRVISIHFLYRRYQIKRLRRIVARDWNNFFGVLCLRRHKLQKIIPVLLYRFYIGLTIGRVFNSLDSHLNGLKIAKSCQTSSNSGLISRYYLRYFSCLTAIYLIFITIFEMKTRPSTSKLYTIIYLHIWLYLYSSSCADISLCSS